MDIARIPAVKDAKKKYESTVKILYKKEAVLNSERKKPNCDFCPINDEYLDFPLQERYKKCNCGKERAVVEAYKEYIFVLDTIDCYKKEYARAVFEVLSISKPRLYSKASKQTVEWDLEFPAEFEKVPKLLYSALISLADGSGGRYVFA